MSPNKKKKFNPSIERTSSGTPSDASHIKRYAS